MNTRYDIYVHFYYENRQQTWYFTELTAKKKRHIITAFNMMAKLSVFKGVQYKVVVLWD